MKSRHWADVLWVAIAMFVLIGFASIAVDAALTAEDISMLRLLTIVIGALATWWIVAGSLRRTSWWRRRAEARR